MTEISKNEIDVNLGGIIPFNFITVKNVGDVSFNLQIFNGTALETVCQGVSKNGEIQIKLSNTVDYAYRFKIVLDKDVRESASLEVYNI